MQTVFASTVSLLAAVMNGTIWGAPQIIYVNLHQSLNGTNSDGYNQNTRAVFRAEKNMELITVGVGLSPPTR